jgi:hypothetical protein
MEETESSVETRTRTVDWVKLNGLHLKTEAEPSSETLCIKYKTVRWIMYRILIVSYEIYLVTVISGDYCVQIMKFQITSINLS